MSSVIIKIQPIRVVGDLLDVVRPVSHYEDLLHEVLNDLNSHLV